MRLSTRPADPALPFPNARIDPAARPSGSSSATCCRDSVRRFHVYFPDPWPKKRHAKRRLFRPGFVRRRWRAAWRRGVRCVIATDHAAVLPADPGRDGCRGLPVSSGCGLAVEDPVSSFETKYRVQGRTIHRAVYSPPAG